MMSVRESLAGTLASKIRAICVRTTQAAVRSVLAEVDRAIRAAQSLDGLPASVQILAPEDKGEIIQLADQYRVLGMDCEMFDFVASKLQGRGVPEEVLARARSLFLAPDATAPAKRFFLLEKETEDARVKAIQDILAQRDYLNECLRQMGYQE